MLDREEGFARNLRGIYDDPRVSKENEGYIKIWNLAWDRAVYIAGKQIMYLPYEFSNSDQPDQPTF